MEKNDILFLYDLLEKIKDIEEIKSLENFDTFSKKINYIKEQIDLQDKLMKVEEEIIKLNSKETKEN